MYLWKILSEERVDEMKVNVVVRPGVLDSFDIGRCNISKELISAFERTQVEKGNAQSYIWQSICIVAVVPNLFDTGDFLDGSEKSFVTQKDKYWIQCQVAMANGSYWYLFEDCVLIFFKSCFVWNRSR